MSLTAISTERCELKTFNDSQNLLGWTLIPVSESDLLDFGLFISRKKNDVTTDIVRFITISTWWHLAVQKEPNQFWIPTSNGCINTTISVQFFKSAIWLPTFFFFF